MNQLQTFDFPKQRIPNSEKDAKWAANCIDWIIAQGQAMRQSSDIEEMYKMLQGNISQEHYAKILNPYNATKEKYKRFPGTLRHYDLSKGIIRRYVSEYIKSPHDFIVGANNAEVVMAKNTKLRQELSTVIEQQIAIKIQQSYQEWLNGGNAPEDFNPQQTIDIDAFVKKFNEDYIDDISAQGQEILNVIKDITEDALFYARGYFDFVTFGECYTYADVVGNELIKKNISIRDAFPIPTDNMFTEDDDMFACRRKLTYQQIMDEFDDMFGEKEKEFLTKYYAMSGTNGSSELAYSIYESYFPEVCDKFSKEDRDIFRKQTSMARDINTGLYDVWHVVWRGEVRRSLVKFVNNAGFIDTRIEADDYKINTEIGDIDIEYVYQSQVYEGVRIGGRADAIYPYDARAIAYERNGKLPYNGLNELLPGLGKFSIIEIVFPFNVFYNIVAYHREMAVAKNKLSILMIAKSLLGTNSEDTIYKILADGVIYYDDTNDRTSLLAQQVRMLNASNSEYITQLGNMLMEIEQTAKNQVDMTPQRYGEIGQNAGKGTTDEAIIRGSMGSVIIEFMMDRLRERDYARDMDYSKLAWIDGLNTSYRADDNSLKYISLNIDNHVYADYLIKGKDSTLEKEKLAQLKQMAFSAAQNGDVVMSVAAIEADNVASAVKLIKEFQAVKDANDKEIKQIEQQIEQMKQEFEKEKIVLKGEEDRKTKELEGMIEAEIQLIKADANMISFDNGISLDDKQAGMERLQSQRNSIERDKVAMTKQNSLLDAFSKERDRQVKREDIAAKVKIAETNKNKYDYSKKPKGRK